MRVLVVGGGSIGRRHAKNLKALGVEDVDVFDVHERARAACGELGVAVSVFDSLPAALAQKPTAAIIATPSHLHVEPALEAIRAGAHVLIEKPVAISLDCTKELEEEAARRGVYAMVGCNLRFDDVYAEVQAALDNNRLGRVYSAHLLFGYDLSAWRPGVDYRDVYSSRRVEGGGIVLDAIHEIDLALRWFGDVRRVQAVVRQTGALASADVEDVADAVLEFKSGVVATLHLNYLDPVYRRHAWIAGDRGVLRVNFASRSVAFESREGTKASSFGDDRNVMYVRELEYFLGVVRGSTPVRIAIREGLDALEVALAIRDGHVLESRPPKIDQVPVVIQARIGSARLPGKVLKTAGGKTMLEIQVERVRRAKRVSDIVIATGDTEADRAIVAEAERIGVKCFVGSESDVLSRYIGAVRKYDMPAVVRLTGDCPLTDPAVVDFTIERFLETSPDYCTNHLPRSVPDGLDVEVISRRAIERADRQATAKPDREHVTRFFYTHPERFEIVAAAPENAVLGACRWTLDTHADYTFLHTVFEALYPKNPAFGMEDILAFLAAHPEVEKKLRDELLQPP